MARTHFLFWKHDLGNMKYADAQGKSLSHYWSYRIKAKRSNTANMAIVTLLYREIAFLTLGTFSGLAQWLLTPITPHYPLWSRPRPSALTGPDGSRVVNQVTTAKSQTLNRPNAPLSTIGEALLPTRSTPSQSSAADGRTLRLVLENAVPEVRGLGGGIWAESGGALKAFSLMLIWDEEKEAFSWLWFFTPDNIE